MIQPSLNTWMRKCEGHDDCVLTYGQKDEESELRQAGERWRNVKVRHRIKVVLVKEREKDRERLTDILIEKQRDRHSKKQKDRQKVRERERQTDRHRKHINSVNHHEQ